jgi:hypothetical protein
MGVHETIECIFDVVDADGSKDITFQEFVDWQREAVKSAGISKERFTELVSKLSALLQTIHTVDAALGGRSHQQAQESTNKIKKPLESQLCQLTAELYQGDESDAKKLKSMWEDLPAHICKQTLLRSHMKHRVPTTDVARMEFHILPCVPALEHKRRLGYTHPWLATVRRTVVFEETSSKKPSKKSKSTKRHKNKIPTRSDQKAADRARARIAVDLSGKISREKTSEQVDEEAEPADASENAVTTDHWYIYEENHDGILMWQPLTNGDEYADAVKSLSPELNVLAAMITEANFEQECSWGVLQAGINQAIDVELLIGENQVQLLHLMEKFAVHVISKTYEGFSQLNAENQQKLIDHYLDTDFKCTVLEAMNILTTATIVQSNPVWEKSESADWKSFIMQCEP